jgi:hypothetical protein
VQETAPGAARAWGPGRFGCAPGLTTPLELGERTLVRAPIVEDDTIIANTNEEPTVTAIEADPFENRQERRGGGASRGVSIPIWKLHLRRDGDTTIEAMMVRDPKPFAAALRRSAVEAQEDGGGERWLTCMI